MAKDESKKEKKSKRKSEVAAMDVDGDVSFSASAPASPEKKSKKEKKSKDTTGDDDDAAGDDEPEVGLSPLAHPLAEKKLSKKLFKTMKKASKSKGHLRRGVAEVVKALKKNEKGLIVLAGDISPIDVTSHIPVLCEDSSNPYVYVPSKEQLGSVSNTKRPTSVVMIVPTGPRNAAGQKPKEDYTEEYTSVHKEVQALSDKVAMA